MDQFILNALQSAMYLDCLENSHPINQPVNNPNEVMELFDSISYDKVNIVLNKYANIQLNFDNKTPLGLLRRVVVIDRWSHYMYLFEIQSVLWISGLISKEVLILLWSLSEVLLYIGFSTTDMA